MSRNIHIMSCLLIGMAKLAAQDSTATVQFSGYVETFYAFDFNRPANNERPVFLYNHNRHNEFNLNLGYLKAAWTDKKVRANIAIAAGTYIADNYAAEPATFRPLLEANAGLKLGRNTWIDIGILPSHIGFEGAISKDCPTLTRSLMAENSPYFETGARLTYTPSQHWTYSALLLNGWQRIARTNAQAAAGTQISWKPKPGYTLNWSTFVGNEDSNNEDRLRIFNNLYGVVQLSTRTQLTAGIDVGYQRKISPDDYSNWWSGVLILRRQLSQKWAAAARAETYTDTDAVILPVRRSPLYSTSLNIDYAPGPNALFRIESRLLGSDQALFAGQSSLNKRTFYTTVSIAVGF